MFTDWGGRKVSEYWGNVFRCGKSGRGKSGFYCLSFLSGSSLPDKTVELSVGPHSLFIPMHDS